MEVASRPLNKAIIAWAVLVSILAGAAYAAGGGLLMDEFDDTLVVWKLQQKDLQLKKLDEEVLALNRRLSVLKQRDLVAIFGGKTEKPAKTYSLPCFHPRSITFSGIRSAANQGHVDFYAVDDFAGLEVFYWDRNSPENFVLYFKTGEGFVPLRTGGDLAQRLAWDLERWGRFKKWLDGRLAHRFPYEVDDQAMRQLYQGEEAIDVREKLQAWTEAGKSRGWTLTTETDDTGTKHYRWRRPDKSLAREAYAGLGYRGPDVLPDHFYEWWENGKLFPDRELSCAVGKDSIWQWRWGRASGEIIQYHTAAPGKWPSSWCWYDQSGAPIRREWDDNGDGIPDLVADGPSPPHAERELPLTQSWAIHPELIPETSKAPWRIQARLIIRQKPVPEPPPAPPGEAEKSGDAHHGSLLVVWVSSGAACALAGLVLWLVRRHKKRLKARDTP
jgi:hypothetical protein